MARKPPPPAVLSFRLPADVKSALDAAARAEDRPTANLAARIIRQRLERNGYLVPPPGKIASARRRDD